MTNSASASVGAPAPLSGGTPALRARDLQVLRGNQHVLRDIDLAVLPGRWTCILGPNGAGKSTLLKALAGTLACTGHIEWMGQALHTLSPRARAQRLAWLGQGEPCADDLRIMDVVMLGRLPHQRWLAAPASADMAAVERALRATDLWNLRGRVMGTLSGGERQRALLARALAVEAPLVLMDEPLTNLDPPHQVAWLTTVRDLCARGVTVLSVLHEVGMALHADELVVLRDGRLVHHGPSADAATHHAVADVFDHRIAIHAYEGQWVVLPRSGPEGAATVPVGMGPTA